MASKPVKPAKKKVRKVSYVHMQKLAAGVSLLAFMVVAVVCLIAQTSVTTMIWRAILVLLAIGIVTRVVIRIFSSYEEMNSGKT